MKIKGKEVTRIRVSKALDKGNLEYRFVPFLNIFCKFEITDFRVSPSPHNLGYNHNIKGISSTPKRLSSASTMPEPHREMTACLHARLGNTTDSQ